MQNKNKNNLFHLLAVLGGVKLHLLFQPVVREALQRHRSLFQRKQLPGAAMYSSTYSNRKRKRTQKQKSKNATAKRLRLGKNKTKKREEKRRERQKNKGRSVNEERFSTNKKLKKTKRSSSPGILHAYPGI